ncbi:hypothetical protein [Tahibacter caeni]|uniref:hypothetical protein n=1 Tax=Tahibacter caeni TaxID=1453545 RepID=UPI002147CDFA|nr:hypothetical protein [Tahibacter caeni]
MRLILLFACCLALLPVLPAAAGDPTDDAFDALLSLPQAQPAEGEWNIRHRNLLRPLRAQALIRRCRG